MHIKALAMLSPRYRRCAVTAKAQIKRRSHTSSTPQVLHPVTLRMRKSPMPKSRNTSSPRDLKPSGCSAIYSDKGRSSRLIKLTFKAPSFTAPRWNRISRERLVYWEQMSEISWKLCITLKRLCTICASCRIQKAAQAAGGRLRVNTRAAALT